MRIWLFDRLGGIASEKFDIHKNALKQFALPLSGFFGQTDTELGFDPTIFTLSGRRIVEIERNGEVERLVIDQLINRVSCIAGRATTCWKAHRDGHPEIPLVIKDFWQDPKRVEEGELLRQTTEHGVVNVARYYFHETVRVCGISDDVWGNVRKSVDITSAENTASSRKRKRSSSQSGADLRAGERRF